MYGMYPARHRNRRHRVDGEPQIPFRALGRSAEDGWNCGELNKETGIQPCSRLVPDDSERTRDDIRESAPSWKEVCGRSAMSGRINSTSMGGAFSSGFSTKYRILDMDPYWVDFLQFAHCDASKVTVTCTVPKP